MIKPEDVFRRVIGALETAGIPYMLTGSFASAVHGAPRATQDIDFVIAPTSAQLRTLCSSLPPTEYYIDLDTALEALADESMFNVVDLATGWKVDLIIRKSRPFSLAEFQRRSSLDALGLRISVVSAEDLVIAKLEWAKSGQSARQLEDVTSFLRANWETLDRDHIIRWSKDLGLYAELSDACKKAGFVV